MRDRNEILMFGFRGFPAVQGGIEAHVENLAPRLVASGHHVTACMRSPYVGPEDNAPWKGVRRLRIWTVRSSWIEALLHSLVCAAIAGVRRPAIVHIHGIGPALMAPLLRLLGLRVVVTHHGPDYEREKWGELARLVLRIGEAAGAYCAHRQIAVSRAVQKLVADKYGKLCDYIPNGVVLPQLTSNTERIRQLGLQPGHYVLTVGRLVPEKRHLDLLGAFALARPPGWKLAIVGRVDHENDYANRVVAQAAMAPDVVLTGFRNGEDLRQLYTHAGLFVLPSSHEGLPIALLEALSYGVPVLVSNIPANREVITDPARVFATGDIAELAVKISSAAAAADSAGGREASRREAVRAYDWDAIADRTGEVYADVMQKPAAIAGVSGTARSLLARAQRRGYVRLHMSRKGRNTA